MTGAEWVVGACAAWLDAAEPNMKAPKPTAAAKIRSIPILLGRKFTDIENGSGLFMSSAQMCAMLFDRFYQHCPKCGQKSRRLILSKKLVETKVVESSKRSWSRNGNWPVDEPMAIWLYSYQITRRCRICGHQWAEQVTKQRPW